MSHLAFGLFPDCECKVTPFFRTMQIFEQLFFKKISPFSPTAYISVGYKVAITNHIKQSTLAKFSSPVISLQIRQLRCLEEAGYPKTPAWTHGGLAGAQH
jgi:hypothetical protein